MIPTPEKTTVAAFDLDDTLTFKDSLWPFLCLVKGWTTAALLITKQFPSVAAYLLKRISRQEFKERVLTAFFAGMSFEEIERQGQAFSEGHLDRLMRPVGLKKLQWHISQGHRCILVTAAIDVYAKQWGLRHGFEKVIASHLEITPSGKVTGRLQGLNCWGSEKTRRLQQYLGERNTYTLYAYGDSQGDREMLALADFPFYRRFY